MIFKERKSKDTIKYNVPRVSMHKSIYPIFLRLMAVVFAALFLEACYSPVDGCTDPESTNYAISADNLCEDCCQFPQIRLSIFHENKDTTFNLKDTITNDLNQQISLLDYVYLLSDFKIQIGEEIYEISDSISLNVDDGVEYVKDDVIRVSRSEFTFDLGTIIFDGTTDQLSFKTGIIDALNENEFTSEVSGHPLTTDPDSLYQSESETYVFQRIQVAQGKEFLDTVVYDIRTAIDVTFPLNFESFRGENKTIIIEAQYDRWFDGIDFDVMSKEDIEAALAQNTTGVFQEKN